MCPAHQTKRGRRGTGTASRSSASPTTSTRRGARILDAALPEVTQALLGAGATTFDMLALEHDQMTQARVTPWYQNTVMFDRARKEEIDASIEGRRAPESPGPMAQFQQAFGVAMLYDPGVFRDMMEFISMMALPEQVFTRDGFVDRVAAAAEGHEAFVPLGPSRSDLLKALA